MSEAKPDCFLGIDTSNYTTSVGIYCENGEIVNSRKLLPVPVGMCGLRQSDALFEHVRGFASVFASAGVDSFNIKGIGVSTRPRNIEGSYMPCFTYGISVAQVLSNAYSVPLYEFSHQQGHIAAGVLSSERNDLFNKPFYAFHASGGTTELLKINNINDISIAASTLDISVGQLVDRCGVMCELPFPCGKYVEALANDGKLPEKIKIKLKDGNCALSGYENKIRKMLESGVSKNDVSRYVLEVVAEVVSEMILANNKEKLPVLCVGGVMSDMIIRDALRARLSAFDLSFSEASLSSDNAVGTAYLAFRSNNEQ